MRWASFSSEPKSAPRTPAHSGCIRKYPPIRSEEIVGRPSKFTASSASSADECESEEPGYRQIQREAGEEPEIYEAVALERLNRTLGATKVVDGAA
jgi:hypothetical protein